MYIQTYTLAPPQDNDGRMGKHAFPTWSKYEYVYT